MFTNTRKRRETTVLSGGTEGKCRDELGMEGWEMPGASLYSHRAPMVTDPWRQDLKGSTASLDAACLEHYWPQESAFLTTHTRTLFSLSLSLCNRHAQAYGGGWRWRDVGRERAGLSYVVCHCSLLWSLWVFQIPAGREGKVGNLWPHYNKTPFSKDYKL